MTDLILDAADGQPVPATSIQVIDTTTENFRTDVVEASMAQLVLVDFWAEWCGPCKALGPVLEKVVASYQGKVRLVKVDIDKNQMLASQMRVQSVPTVYAFAGGRPVDGFAGALPESQVRAFIDRHAAAFNDAAPDFTEALAQGEALLAQGQAGEAAGLFSDILQAEEGNGAAIGGLVRALVALGETEQARQILDGLDDALARDAHVAQARAALDLALTAADAGELAPLEAAVAADPASHQARLDLANALMAAGRREEAADHLLASIERDRNWNDAAARQLLLRMFEAAGAEDPFTLATRRRLSSILFA